MENSIKALEVSVEEIGTVEVSKTASVVLERIAEELKTSINELRDPGTVAIIETGRAVVVELAEEVDNSIKELEGSVEEIGTVEVINITSVELERTAEVLKTSINELEDPGTVANIETDRAVVVELESAAEELEDVGTELKIAAEEVAMMEVGRMIGVELGIPAELVGVGKTIGVELESTVEELEDPSTELGVCVDDVATIEVDGTADVVGMNVDDDVDEVVDVLLVGQTLVPLTPAQQG